jgi:hypothetical protein
MDEEMLFDKALKKWGVIAQLEMVVEECEVLQEPGDEDAEEERA